MGLKALLIIEISGKDLFCKPINNRLYYNWLHPTLASNTIFVMFRGWMLVEVIDMVYTKCGKIRDTL